ncbi:galactokinase [Nocardioides sp.]|uniref:galactokinase n=1 Tax=Nocardioides sp. TaxID=35761 RepID=UPI0031FEDA17|nr:galK [Nocardioides sp.]
MTTTWRLDELGDDLDPGRPRELSAALVATFERLHGVPPAGVFAAPGRVNLMGEHTDYNGGWCLPMALPHATYVAVRRRDDRRLTVTSLQQVGAFSIDLDGLDPASLRGWSSYPAGVVWLLEASGLRMPGMDLVIDSRVPVGAGLSSSAALECAVALAACAMAEVAVDAQMRRRLIDLCVRAEREIVGSPTGGMDQTAALLARPGEALLLDCLTGRTEGVSWSFPEASLLIVDTRAQHSLSDGQYGDRRAECARAAAALGLDLLREAPDLGVALRRLTDDILHRRVRHVFSENLRVGAAVRAIRGGEHRELGRLFTESHESLRDDFEVSCAELDLVVDTALVEGAYGARMTGGGFGGSAIVLVADAKLARVRAAVTSAFAERGFTRPAFVVATAAGAAAEVESLTR